MCQAVYRVQNCNDSSDVRLLSPPSLSGVQIGQQFEFVQDGTGFSACFIILEIGVQSEACSGGGTYPVLTPYEENWTVPNAELCECPPPVTYGPCGSISCPEGYTLTPEGLCKRIDIVPPQSGTTSVSISGGSNNQFYCDFGTRFYGNVDALTFPLVTTGPTNTPGFLQDDNGAGPNMSPTLVTDCGTDCVWQSSNAGNGRLNIAGIWTDQLMYCGEFQDVTPIMQTLGWLASDPQWIGFSVCVDVPTTGPYCVGLAADNRQRFSVNGELIAEWRNDNTNNFRYFNVIEVTLQEGLNYVEVEGFNIRCSDAAFAAEIYNADTATLQAVTNLNAGDPNGLEDYIIFSTRDLIPSPGDPVAYYDIGTDSGNVCPEGYAYDGCSQEGCVKISYTDPVTTYCCWIISNCADATEQYAIQMDSTAPAIAINAVYEFGTDSIFAGKCFNVIKEEVCEDPDYTGVTVVTSYGLDNCLACSPSEEFESCDDSSIKVYVSLPNFQGTLTPGNVYELAALDNKCYTYVGINEETPASTPTDAVDLQTTYCLICTPCHEFKSCETEEALFVRFADGQTIPTIGNVVDLTGGEIADVCWQYIGEATCDEGEAIIDVIISNDYACKNCDVCKTFYQLTQCCGDTILIVEWAKDEPPLDETKTYIFDFDPDKCFSVKSIPSPCDDETETE